MAASAPLLDFTPPKRLNSAAIFVISAYGLILVFPVLLSMLAVTMLPLGILTFIIPLGTIAVATFFLPLGFGNPYVTRLVRQSQPELATEPESFVVQLTFQPRKRSGWLALAEDADDFGVLRVTDSGLVFKGDSVSLVVPFDQILELKLETTGWRTLFAYGPQTALSISGLAGANACRFAERASWVLPTSRKNARKMYECLARKLV